MKHTFAGIVASLFVLLPMTAANAESTTPGNFDYYVLSLSWSPQYCATSGLKKNDPQCAKDKRYGFVLHGLWPQYAEGGWPEFCTTPAAPVSEAIIAKMLPIEPSRSLILHEWAKHGTCSHLTPETYFGDAAAAYHAVKIPAAYQQPEDYVSVSPAQLTADFSAANPGLDAGEISLFCRGNYLVEARVCLGKDFKPTKCGTDVRTQCGKSVTLRPTK